MLLNKCREADVRQNNRSVLLHSDISSGSQQEMIRFYESVLRFSQISSLPVKGFLICLAPPSSPEASGHICVRQSSTGDFRHQKMDGNVSAMNKYIQQLPSVPPLLQQMLQLDRVLSPMVQCGSTFVYLSSHSRTCLEWMRKLDVHAWSCVYVCVGGRPR